MEFFGEYYNEFEDICSKEEDDTSTTRIYRGYNIKNDIDVCLKVRDKKEIELEIMIF